MNQEAILLVDDDNTFRRITCDLLQDAGYRVTDAGTLQKAKAHLVETRFDLVLCDLVMENETGLDLLAFVNGMDERVPVLMITGYASVESAVEAMKIGAEDYLTKPCSNDALLLKISRTLEKYRTAAEVARLRKELQERFAFGNLVASSDKMRRVLELLEQVADTEASVLITGETGTGKELVARALHQNSHRASHAFVAVNCAALSENLLESELFGHEKGAFTGALQRKEGRFELAHRGTIFLDEIGCISPAMQAKLLRVLQERSFERVGGTETLSVDIRVVAATNLELQEAIGNGEFREDLYYRLNVIPVFLPPLRERQEDIALLANHFAEKYAVRADKPVPEIAPAAIELLQLQKWPGNVRELENMIERAVILSRGGAIEPRHLLLQTRDGMLELLADGVEKRLSEEDLTRMYARLVFAELGQNKKETCKVLQINYRTLQNRLGLDDAKKSAAGNSPEGDGESA